MKFVLSLCIDIQIFIKHSKFQTDFQSFLPRAFDQNSVQFSEIRKNKKNFDLSLNYIIIPCYQNVVLLLLRVHTSSLINIGKTLNRPITKFYNSDDVNVIAAELRLTKTRPTSFCKKHKLL